MVSQVPSSNNKFHREHKDISQRAGDTRWLTIAWLHNRSTRTTDGWCLMQQPPIYHRMGWRNRRKNRRDIDILIMSRITSWTTWMAFSVLQNKNGIAWERGEGRAVTYALPHARTLRVLEEGKNDQTIWSWKGIKCVCILHTFQGGQLMSGYSDY